MKKKQMKIANNKTKQIVMLFYNNKIKIYKTLNKKSTKATASLSIKEL